MALRRLPVQLLSLFFIPLTVCGNMMFQSVGANGKATFLSALRSGLCFIPFIVLLSALFGLTGVEIAQTVSDAATFIITVPFILYFFRTLPEDR